MAAGPFLDDWLFKMVPLNSYCMLLLNYITRGSDIASFIDP